MRRDEWELDDIILGALLGGWLGAWVEQTNDPLTATIVSSTVVVLAYGMHTIVVGEPRMRLVFLLPTGLAVGLLGVETASRMLAWKSFTQMATILTVWLGALGVRTLASALRRMR